MIYVYAVTEPSGRALPEIRGLEEQPLEAQVGERTAAVYSRHGVGHLPPAAENLWRHEAVVEALMRDRAVLPARFGMVFADEAAVERALTGHAERLAAGLDRVRGCVELGLRVLWRPDSAPDLSPPSASEGGPAAGAASGRAYMMARMNEERRRVQTRERAERLADRLHEPLAPLARDSTRRVLPAPDLLTSAAYLVPQGAAEEFASRVRRLAEAHPDLRVLCTGPWPPYHFAPALGPAAAEVRHA